MADTFREQFNDANDRFQQDMLAAIRAHHEGIALFNAHEFSLQESLTELKRLILEQGGELHSQTVQIRAQGEEIRALRERLDRG